MSRTRIFVLGATCALAVAAPASAQSPITSVKLTYNELPVPFTGFDGSYQRSDGSTGTQEGYVKVHVADPGVEACNGNQESRSLDGSTLQGYVWVGGPNPAPNELFGTGDGFAGAGNGDSDGDGVYAPGESPCPDGNDG